MTKEEVAGLIGEFTWDFSQHFFIETNVGNFIWSDPDYGGTGKIVKTDKSLQEYFGESYGRDKGQHYIGNYCGDFIWESEVINRFHEQCT